MRTRKTINEVLSRMMETGGMDEAREEDFGILRDEFEERDSYLRQVAEPWDDEAESVDVVLKTANGDTARYDELKGKYDSLVQRYTAKFFAGGETHELDGAVDEAEGVIIEDDAPDEPPEMLTVEDLFKEVEDDGN